MYLIQLNIKSINVKTIWRGWIEKNGKTIWSHTQLPTTSAVKRAKPPTTSPWIWGAHGFKSREKEPKGDQLNKGKIERNHEHCSRTQMTNDEICK